MNTIRVQAGREVQWHGYGSRNLLFVNILLYRGEKKEQEHLKFW